MTGKTMLGTYMEGLTRQLDGRPLHVQPVSGEPFVLVASHTEQDGEILCGSLGAISTQNVIPISQIVRVWYNPDDLKSS